MHEQMNARWLRWCLTGIVVLLAVIAVQLSALIGPLQPRAQAQIPDSGLQRQQLLDAQLQTNRTLDAILQHLRTQSIKVTLAGTDKGTGGAPAPSPRPGAPGAAKPPRIK
ncbi:MAG: hypothetical protein AMXMBFR13_38120 [Phycisphaerae bacterium]|jgi:hypothetical protein